MEVLEMSVMSGVYPDFYETDWSGSFRSHVLRIRKKLPTSTNSAVNSMVSAFLEGKTTMDVLHVPARLCGLVIGKRGSAVNYIRQKTGCTLQVGIRMSGYQPVFLFGEDNEVVEAGKREISLLMPGQQERNSIYGLRTQQFVRVDIPGELVGLLLGIHGSTFRLFQLRTGVSMKLIQNYASERTAYDKTLVLMGHPSITDEAVSVLNHLLEKANKPNLGRWMEALSDSRKGWVAVAAYLLLSGSTGQEGELIYNSVPTIINFIQSAVLNNAVTCAYGQLITRKDAFSEFEVAMGNGDVSLETFKGFGDGFLRVAGLVSHLLQPV